MEANFENGKWNTVYHQGKNLPYPVSIFENFLHPADLEDLRFDVRRLILKEKSNDLFKFYQSPDLADDCRYELGVSAALKRFFRLLNNKVAPMLNQNLGVELVPDQIDYTVSLYRRGDYLLCHNDYTKRKNGEFTRAVAFVFYLVPSDFKRKDGGTFTMFYTDRNGWAFQKAATLLPVDNSILMFETTPNSWHAVDELFHPTMNRYSINGWFYARTSRFPLEYPLIGYASEFHDPSELFEPTELRPSLRDHLIGYIADVYTEGSVFDDVRNQFRRNGETCLDEFLEGDIYEPIAKYLQSLCYKPEYMKLVGTYEKRLYWKYDLDKIQHAKLNNLIKLFRSDIFFLYLKQMTGIELEPLELRDKPDYPERQLKYKKEEIRLEVEQQATASPHISSPAGVSTLSGTRSATFKAQNSEEEASPVGRLELLCFDAACYTMVQDFSKERKERSAVDVMMIFNHEYPCRREVGGYFTYMKTGQGSRLAPNFKFLEPRSNAFFIVHRQSRDYARFLKYITCDHRNRFQVLSATYYLSRDHAFPVETKPIVPVKSGQRRSVSSSC